MEARAIGLRVASPAWRAYLPHAVACACAATIVGGALARARGDGLGAPLAPFFATWSPHAGGLVVPAAAVLLVAAALAPQLRDRPASPLAFAAAAFGLALVARVALALAGGGPGRLWAVFSTDPEAPREYLPALPALHVGLRPFLDRFAEVAPSLPTHPSAHPPGLLVTLDVLGIGSAPGLAALTIGAGALAVPVTYGLGRRLLHEREARTAALLFAFASSALLYGATSADALYATLGAAAAWALLARPALGGALLAVASFFSVALLGVGAWAVAALAAAGRRRRALLAASAGAAGCVAFYAALAAFTGFDPLGTLRSFSDAYNLGIASVRPYGFWLFGSPTAFLVALGLPLAWFALRGVAAGDPPALALAAVVGASAVLGFTKAENERIWLFLVPFACVAAAAHVPRRRLGLVLGALAAQALAVEVLLRTIW